MEGTRDQQNPKKSTRLTETRKLEVEEEERKVEQERKRAKTMFQRKSKVIGPNDMIVDTTVGKIHLGPEYVSEDVKVKVELNCLEEASGSFEEQGEVIVTQEVNIKAEDEDGDNGHPIGGEFRDVGDERIRDQSLTAVVEQLKTEMKQRLGEQDQKIVQLTAELEAAKAEVVSVKEKGEDKINELQETVTELQLQLSLTKDGPDATASKEELASTNNQLQGQKRQGHLLAQNDLDLQGNPDQHNSDDMAALSPESNDNCGSAVEHPDVLESLLEKKSRNERIKPLAPVFEAVLNILVERKRTVAGNLNGSSVCGVMKKCRLVCQSWKASVDSVLQTHPSHLELLKPRDCNIITNKGHFSPCPLILSTVEKVFGVRWTLDIVPSKMGQFIMSLPSANVDYNPVPTRHLRVQTTSSWSGWYKKTPEPTGNVYPLSDYLRAFGHQIWYLRLSLGHGVQGSDFEEVCSSVSEILHLVPNLRLLSFNLDHKVLVGKRVHLSESEMECQFPHLKHLVAVECPQENPVIVQILKVNSHVERLAFHQLWYRESTAILKLDLPNLSELFISYDNQIKMEIFQDANVTWKIRKLRLRLNYPGHKVSWNSIQSMIDGLALFGASLEDLTLEIGSHDVRFEGMQLKLPRLKRLHVQTQKWDEIDWDVLLVELKLLETLEIGMHVENPALIDFFHEEQDWLTMPQLRSITLIAKKGSGYRIVDRDERTIKLKRVGMPLLKFNYIKVKLSCVSLSGTNYN